MPSLSRKRRADKKTVEQALTKEEAVAKHADLMSAFKNSNERVAYLKKVTPRGLWPDAWVREEQEAMMR